MDLKELQVVEVKGIRTLTSKQLTECYGTTTDIIKKNFSRNRERYVEGKHYIYMDRDELREVKTTYPQFEGELKRTSRTHFWTEKGALLHAKSLNTDKAWEVYEYLVDFYFRAKEVIPVQEQPKSASVKDQSDREVVDIPENMEIQEAIKEAEDYITALSVALKEYNMYRSKKSYENYYMMLNNLSVTTTRKLLDLLELKPNMVIKPGY